MNNFISVFNRIESKYVIQYEDFTNLMKIISKKIKPDSYPESRIYSLYLDTPDRRLIRTSLDGVSYKEKVRIRSYNDSAVSGNVFLEIKKKYLGTVYKRRIAAKSEAINNYIISGVKPLSSQIANEIDYLFKYYGRLEPSMLITYNRKAFVSKENEELRITFDDNIRYKADDMKLYSACDGEAVTAKAQIIMEIKSISSMPLWLSEALDKCRIFPSSFSKYGNAYRKYISEGKGEIKNAGNF